MVLELLPSGFWGRLRARRALQLAASRDLTFAVTTTARQRKPQLPARLHQISFAFVPDQRFVPISNSLQCASAAVVLNRDGTILYFSKLEISNTAKLDLREPGEQDVTRVNNRGLFIFIIEINSQRRRQR